MENIYKFFHNIIKIFLISIWDDEISCALDDSDVHFKKRLLSLFFGFFFFFDKDKHDIFTKPLVLTLEIWLLRIKAEKMSKKALKVGCYY